MSAEALIQAAAGKLLAAPHGSKSRIAAELAEQMGCSVQTAYRRLQQVTGSIKPRKKRSDAGELALTRDEAAAIAALVEETRRLTGTGTLPVEDAVEILRANDRIEALRVDKSTGELVPLSVSSICRAIRAYGFHRDQLAAPTPAARLASPHPNHLWQIDASVSRQFYLAANGTEVMDKRRFYRGKPENFTKIAENRLWRYAIRAAVAPRSVMTGWVAGEQLPAGLSLGEECELRDPVEGGATIRCQHQELRCDEVEKHLEAGKQVYRLALIMEDTLSFVISDDLVIRKLKFLDGAFDSLAELAEDEQRQEMDARFALQTGQLSRLFNVLQLTFQLEEEA